MPVYPRRNDDPRALARELASLRAAILAARRRTTNVPSNVPPPDEVTPGVLAALAIEGGQW